MFIYAQIDIVIQSASNYQYVNNDAYIFVGTLLVLIPLSIFESMEAVAYFSIVAILSILFSQLCLMCDDVMEIVSPSFTKELIWADFGNIPEFFGIALFVFEGNTLILEIYY